LYRLIGQYFHLTLFRGKIMSEPTFFQDDAAATARALEVTAASFVNGANLGGSCAPGIGINMNEGAVVGTDEQFTLLDQFGNAREAQISQSIGGFPFVDRVADAVPWPGSGGTEGTAPDAVIQFGTLPTNAEKVADPALDGTITSDGNSTLTTLSAGWVVNV
jgi:hypothetical protein